MNVKFFSCILFFLACFCGIAKGQEEVTITQVQASSLLNLIAEKGARVTVVNMWATWCIPCLKEFPALVKLAHAYKNEGLRVLLVSNDLEQDLPAVRKFLAKQGVDFPTYIKAEKDDAFINGINPRWSGALPTTFIYDKDGKLLYMLEGEQDYNQFEEKVKPLLMKE